MPQGFAVSSTGLAEGPRAEVPLWLGYNGQAHEPATRWQCLGNGYRVYDSRMMRFHSPDNLSPFGKGGTNAYAYCGGDPVNNADPSGHFYIKMMSLVSVFVGLGATLGFAGVAVSTQSTEQRALAIGASVAGFAAMLTAGRYIYIKRHTKLPTAPAALPRAPSITPSAPPLSPAPSITSRPAQLARSDAFRWRRAPASTSSASMPIGAVRRLGAPAARHPDFRTLSGRIRSSFA